MLHEFMLNVLIIVCPILLKFDAYVFLKKRAGEPRQVFEKAFLARPMMGACSMRDAALTLSLGVLAQPFKGSTF